MVWVLFWERLFPRGARWFQVTLAEVGLYCSRPDLCLVVSWRAFHYCGIHPYADILHDLYPLYQQPHGQHPLQPVRTRPIELDPFPLPILHPNLIDPPPIPLVHPDAIAPPQAHPPRRRVAREERVDPRQGGRERRCVRFSRAGSGSGSGSRRGSQRCVFQPSLVSTAIAYDAGKQASFTWRGGCGSRVDRL